MEEAHELVLVAGDLGLGEWATSVPECFRELLETDKVTTVLCPGPATAQDLEYLSSVCRTVYVACESATATVPHGTAVAPTHALTVGGLRIGLVGASDDLLGARRALDADVLVYPGARAHACHDGHHFLAPGSLTGHSAHPGGSLPGELVARMSSVDNNDGTLTTRSQPTPSTIQAAIGAPTFLLMDVCKETATIYTYSAVGNRATVRVKHATRKKDSPVSL